MKENTKTPESILKSHYATHSANRLTSKEEFNSDGAVMVKAKALFLKAEQKWRNDPTEYRRSVADRVKKYVFAKAEALKRKHWNITPKAN